jgi:diguanylate cyclase (GGDEF)-like protein
MKVHSLLLIGFDPSARSAISDCLSDSTTTVVVADATAGVIEDAVADASAPLAVVAAAEVASVGPDLIQSGIPFLACVTDDGPITLSEAVSTGAIGLTSESVGDIKAAVSAIRNGGSHLAPRFAGSLFSELVRLRRRDMQRTKELEALVEQLHDVAATDYLTGLHSRGYFFDRLTVELDRALRHSRPVSVLIVDIDGLNDINGRRGRDAGDRVIRDIGIVIGDVVRSVDIACRTGGDEFAVILPETAPDGAYLVAERIRESVRGLVVGGVGSVTVSVGVAGAPSHASTTDDLVDAADRALFVARSTLGGSAWVVDSGVAGIETASRRTRAGIVDVLVRVIRLRDPQLAVRAERTEAVAIAIGTRLGLSTAHLEHLAIAALLSDVGKIGLPDSILYKTSPLTDDDWEAIHEFPKRGFELLGGFVHPDVAEAVLSTHERWDGTGYPRKLNGEAIPEFSRILHVADAYSAMTTDRPYRSSLPLAESLVELRRCSGTQFDPRVVAAAVEELVLGEGHAMTIAG